MQKGKAVGMSLASPVCGHGYIGICLAEISLLLLLMGNSVVPHELKLTYRMPLDQTVFIIE